MAREAPAQRLVRMTAMERELWAQGYIVGGVDEAGRGPLAGPVAAACVCMPQIPLLEGINDSKKLTSLQRKRLDGSIREIALSIGVALADVEEIERLNIRGATRLAMERAIAGADASFVLTDAERDLRIAAPQRSLVRGDAHSYQIAAASIVAKVYRDGLMEEYHQLYPQYGFDRNKGYGTPEHMRALREHGPCPIHRGLFLRKILGGPLPCQTDTFR